ncbi:DNA polymerase III subunit delta' [Aurantiacibacter gangjinensis]|uniref:DNA polymerase III subunit delta n=1 Tax=Aurantiacibacter gangjinensis TaxID=502682 RepID=A0A0G9MQE3_9SPHN|nr:DNA polymerase III subunit delta' [Aurantiacibacter gangjinensis]APE28778.1 DNA polymerase III delta prime subunit [Aurantiacibacter gangjinensis]KLE32930.1 DNA polymerase III subunit delta' [Aurantiacibacter gangjinensis]
MSLLPSDYIGHDAAWTQWRRALAGERMHHGWILSGRRGVGKSAFAMAAARELVAEDGVPQPDGDHPDIRYVSHPPKNDGEARKRVDGKPFELARNIKVDQVRELQRRLTTRPTLGSRRAVIIDPADDMEPGAANALLKSLEEPPAGTYFLLIAHRIGRLLPTIRSRCRVLTFPRVSDNEMDAVLSRESPQASSEMRAAAIAAASGSPGGAIDFVELDLGRVHALMRRVVDHGDPDFRLRGELAGAMGNRPSRDKQLAAIELARAVVADHMRSVQGEGIPALVETHGALVRLAGQAPTYNFDAGLLVMEIGTLLANLAGSRTPANG